MAATGIPSPRPGLHLPPRSCSGPPLQPRPHHRGARDPPDPTLTRHHNAPPTTVRGCNGNRNTNHRRISLLADADRERTRWIPRRSTGHGALGRPSRNVRQTTRRRIVSGTVHLFTLIADAQRSYTPLALVRDLPNKFLQAHQQTVGNTDGAPLAEPTKPSAPIPCCKRSGVWIAVSWNECQSPQFLSAGLAVTGIDVYALQLPAPCRSPTAVIGRKCDYLGSTDAAILGHHYSGFSSAPRS